MTEQGSGFEHSFIYMLCLSSFLANVSVHAVTGANVKLADDGQ